MNPERERKEVVILTIEAGETSLSTRKLLIESAGFNALSAVSASQGLAMAERYLIHGVLLDAEADDLPLDQFINAVHEHRPGVPVYLVARHGWVNSEMIRLVAGVFEKMQDPKIIVEELAKAFPVPSEVPS